jgi:hypothetical protein
VSGCAALAVGIGGNGYGFASRTSLGGAISAAMVTCTNANPQGCQLKDSFCDTSYGFKPGNMTQADRDALEAAQERGRSYRAQRNAQQWIQAGRIATGIIGGYPTYRTLPAYRPVVQPRVYNPPGRVQPAPTGGSAHCPGAEIAVDQNCRPIR